MKKQIKFTTRKNQLSISIFIFLGAFMLFGICQASFGQIIRTNPPLVKPTPTPQRKPLIFKGTAVEKAPPEVERFRQLPMPSFLSAAEKQNAFKQALLENGVNVPLVALPYALLTPRNVFVNDRAALGFFNPYGIMPLENFASYGYADGGNDSGFRVSVKPTKVGQWFMVDCSLSVAESRKFRIDSPDGSVTEKTISGTEHIQVFFLAQKTIWHSFVFLTAPGTPPWIISSCEVTEAN